MKDDLSHLWLSYSPLLQLKVHIVMIISNNHPGRTLPTIRTLTEVTKVPGSANESDITFNVSGIQQSIQLSLF